MINEYLQFLNESSIQNISFPKNEWNDIRRRLDLGLDISTVRICNEYNKYKKGITYKTDFGYNIEVIDIQKFKL